MNRKYLTAFIAGLCIFALMGATFKTLVLDESGDCSQSVNFTGTTTLNSAAIATQAYSDGLVSTHNADGSAHSSAFAAKLTAANNLSDVSSVSTARTNLGLGTAATQNVGTSAGNVVQLDGSAKLPAVDGSALTNLPASGESNTASNVGTGTGVFAQKSGVDLQFKSLIAGTNIEITYDSTGITISATGSASGEANTASNIGVGGVGVFAQKSGVDLQFKNIIAGSNKVLVSDDTADSEIAVDVQPGNIAHQDLSGAGTNTHSQIDSHISSTSNPHSVTAAQVGAISTAGTAEINGLAEKTTPANDDEIVIEDSAASYAKKKVKISNLPSGSGSTDDTSRGDGTWTSTTSSPSQRATEEALNDSGVRYDDRASASGVSDHERLLMRNVSSDSANTKLLLHFEGDDASTTFTDSSEALQEITAYGNAQIDTAYYKFGAASGLFDGTGDYLGLTDSTDYNLGISASPFTIEFWYKSSTSANMCFYNRGGGGSDWSMTNGWQQLIQYETSGEMVFYYNNNGSSVRVSQTASVDGNWHHVAVVYDGTTTYVYVDGARGTGVTTGGYYKPATSNVTRIGYYQNSSGGYFNGSLDEFRISKGVARWSANFSVPTSAYSVSTERDNRMSSVKVSDINHAMCQGRLTLESGVPVSTTDQTAKTTLYFTPNVTGENCGNKITIYDGTKWVLYSFSELSLSLSGFTASTNYDIFIYDNTGTLTLSATAWTNNTTRATELTAQDGIYVKTGATNYRYLGTIRITSTTGQCEDSNAKRFVWNMYNRVVRNGLSSNSNATWSYSTATFREYNGGSGQTRFECVNGLATHFAVESSQFCTNAGSNTTYLQVGIDSTTNGYRTKNYYGNYIVAEYGTAESYISIGYHYFTMIEYCSGGTSTIYGGAGYGAQFSFLN